MSDILVELTEQRRRDAALREAEIPFAEMMRRASSAPAPLNGRAALRRGLNTAENHPTDLTSELRLGDSSPRIIAELKRASPSEGMIRDDFHPVELAKELVAAGAAALSVLCEPHRFLGSEDYLRAVRGVVDVPILYKDFLSTRYQIAAARAAGADIVLLIAAVLDDATLMDLLDFAHSLGMCALVETHDKAEIDRAVAVGADIIGVNCRNLRNFSTDVSLLESLVAEIPSGCIRVAESGMHTREAIDRARTAGADAFLIGTALMRSPHPGEKLKEFLSSGNV